MEKQKQKPKLKLNTEYSRLATTFGAAAPVDVIFPLLLYLFAFSLSFCRLSTAYRSPLSENVR